MEICLGIVVVVAVFFFGVLISIGNERQRKAIDDLREQVVAWAMQDIRIKRENIKREITIENPMAWLNQMVAKVYGESLDLKLLEIVKNPTALICEVDGGLQVIVSPSRGKDVTTTKKGKLNKLNTGHVLQDVSKKTQVIELSILNSGMFFDCELENAWKEITGQSISSNKCFVYLKDWWG